MGVGVGVGVRGGLGSFLGYLDELVAEDGDEDGDGAGALLRLDRVRVRVRVSGRNKQFKVVSSRQ